MDKKIYRYTNVELLDLIEHGQNKSMVSQAETELEKRNLTEEELKNMKMDYIKFKEFQEKRKNEPLTDNEWISFFFLPFFTPRPRWRPNDHFTESEYERFEKYGFEKKARQAGQVQLFGAIFWLIIIIGAILLYNYLKK